VSGGARSIGIAAAVFALAVGGCGKTKKELLPGSSAGAQPRSLQINAAGTAKRANFTLPDSIRAGLTRIDFRNDAQGSHALQFVRVDGSHSDAAALKATGGWANGGHPLPAWLHPQGGTQAAPSGTRNSTIQMLPPGRYILVDTEAKGPPAVAATLNATGDSTGAVPGAPSRITTYEYGFKSVGLVAAGTRILIQNTGRQPHEVEAAPLKPGKTAADVRRFLKDHKGPSPVVDKAGVRSAVFDAGQRAQVDLRLHKGRVALLCFVPDRKGGPPHAFKGMVSVANVR
jgi:hypothetical protein